MPQAASLWPLECHVLLAITHSGERSQRNTDRSSLLSEVRPPTGEPDAGNRPVRFGGRGAHALPTPISMRYVVR